MVRLVAVAAVLLSLSGFAQAGTTPEQQCQMKCGEAMSACMMPCMGGDPKGSIKPENKDKTMACVRGCADKQQPCMAKCEKGKK